MPDGPASRAVVGRVRFRCGAEGRVRYPAGHPEVLSRLRQRVGRRDCPACERHLAPEEAAAPHVEWHPPDVWLVREGRR
jgi:hypothetical protein